MDDLLTDFLIETNESLADLDVAVLKLERTPDDGATLSLIFRLVHTIKGTCGFLGLPRLERVAHAAEQDRWPGARQGAAGDAGAGQQQRAGGDSTDWLIKSAASTRKPNRMATMRR